MYVENRNYILYNTLYFYRPVGAGYGGTVSTVPLFGAKKKWGWLGCRGGQCECGMGEKKSEKNGSGNNL